jgi:hypothetical protein
MTGRNIKEGGQFQDLETIKEEMIILLEGMSEQNERSLMVVGTGETYSLPPK